MISVLTWAFSSCSTKATTDASVVPASRGLAHTARPFSVGAAVAGVTAATRAARTNDARVRVLPGCIGVSFRLFGSTARIVSARTGPCGRASREPGRGHRIAGIDRRVSLIRRAAVLLALLALPGPGCGPRPELRLSGRTMGTTWHVTLVGRGSAADLQEKIERRLEEVNQSLSTYREDSEISRFNRFPRVGRGVPDLRGLPAGDEGRGAGLRAVRGRVGRDGDAARRSLGLRAGRPRGRAARREEKIASSLAEVGFAKIEIRDSGALVKREASVTLDLVLDREGLRGRPGGRARPPGGLHGLHRRDRRRGPRRRDAAGRAALEGGHQPARGPTRPPTRSTGSRSCATRRSPRAATTATTSSGTGSATRTSSTRGPAAP